MTDRELIEQLVCIRKARGLSLKQVARRLYVTPAAVCLLEHSVQYGRSPTIGRILRYAQVVGAELHATPTQEEQ